MKERGEELGVNGRCINHGKPHKTVHRRLIRTVTSEDSAGQRNYRAEMGAGGVTDDCDLVPGRVVYSPA